MNLLIINGPNLNLLGEREPEVYGGMGFDDYLKELRKEFSDHELEYFQSNHEGEIIEKVQAKAFNAIILNAGAYSHTSIGIMDAVRAVEIPVYSVHISDPSLREGYRHDDLIAPHAQGYIAGLGLRGYAMAIEIAIEDQAK